MTPSTSQLDRSLIRRRVIFSSVFALATLWVLPACDRKQEPTQQAATSQESAPVKTGHESVTRTELASAGIPSGREKPHVFKLMNVTLPPGETMSYAGAERLVFQISGSQSVTVDNQETTLKPHKGMRIETGMPATFSTQGEQPSQSLHYLLVPEPQADRSINIRAGEMSQIYRNQAPITWSPDKEQVLSLAQLTFLPSTPMTAPHYRTGAALYYVLSGTGQFSTNGTTEEKAAGSVIYEPSGVLHQWANPGTELLTLVVANVAVQGEPAIRFDTAQLETGPSQ